ERLRPRRRGVSRGRCKRAANLRLPSFEFDPIENVSGHKRVDLVESIERQYGDTHGSLLRAIRALPPGHGRVNNSTERAMTFAICPLCEAACGLEIGIENDR